MKKWILCLLLLVVVVAACSCALTSSGEAYDKAWIMGKTSSEIEEKYGQFDICLNDEKQGNKDCATGCGYLTRKGKAGLLGSTTDEFLMIFFNEEGIAYSIEEDYPRPGG